MKIIVIGAGKVGQSLCQDLSSEGHDIILVEKNFKILDEILSNLDIMGIVGDGANNNILLEAGVGEADMFLSVTDSDTLNMMASIIAKTMGAKFVIARVRNPEYSSQMKFMSEAMGIDLMINPELETAKHIFRNIKYARTLEVESFYNGKVNIVKILLEQDTYLDGISLIKLKQEYFKTILVCIVNRNDEIFIPTGDFILKSGDIVYVTASQEDLMAFHRSLGNAKKRMRSIIIFGGGRISHYLLTKLSEIKVDVKIIENNESKAIELSENFENVSVIHGDAMNKNTLEEEGFKNYDVAVALTGIDESNIILSLYAKSLNIRKIITKVNNVSLLDIIGLSKLHSIVTPKKIISDDIIKVVRSFASSQHSNIENLYRLENNQVEAIEFIMKIDSELIGKQLKDLNLKSNTLISTIIRNNKVILPAGNDCLLEKDRVIVITTEKFIDDIDKLLK